MKAKKLFTSLLLAGVISVCLFAFTACKTPAPVTPEDGADTVIIKVNAGDESYSGGFNIAVSAGDESYEVNTQKEYVGLVLDELKETKGLNLVTSGDAGSEFGRMLLEIGGVKPSADTDSHEFIAFYGTTDDIQYAMLEMYVEVGGVKYYSLNYGIDVMPLLDGVSYLFAISTW